jgi:hypothetical protein
MRTEPALPSVLELTEGTSFDLDGRAATSEDQEAKRRKPKVSKPSAEEMPQQIPVSAMRRGVEECLEELREMMQNMLSKQDNLSRRMEEALLQGSRSNIDVNVCKSPRSPSSRRPRCDLAAFHSCPARSFQAHAAETDGGVGRPGYLDRKKKSPAESSQVGRMMSFDNLDDMYTDALMKEGCGDTVSVGLWHKNKEWRGSRGTSSSSKGTGVLADFAGTDYGRSGSASAQPSLCSPTSNSEGVERSLSPSSPREEPPRSPGRANFSQAGARKHSKPRRKRPPVWEDEPTFASLCVVPPAMDASLGAVLPNRVNVIAEQGPPQRNSGDERRVSLGGVMDKMDMYGTTDSNLHYHPPSDHGQAAVLSEGSSSSVQGMEAMRQKQEEVIIDEEYIPSQPEDIMMERRLSSKNVSGHDARSPCCDPQRILYVFGILPSRYGLLAVCYHRLMCLATLCSIVYGIFLATDGCPIGDEGTTADFSGPGHVFRYRSLLDVFCALGCLVSLFSLRHKGIHRLLGRCADRPLEMIAEKYGILEEWKRDSRQCFYAAIGMFMFEVVLRSLLSFVFPSKRHDEAGVLTAYGFPVFLFTSGLFTALIYCHLHMCCGLGWLVDQFYWELCRGLDCNKGMRRWSVVQAFLRHAATTMETSFVAILTAVFWSLVLLGADSAFGLGHEEPTFEYRLRSGLLPLMPKILMVFYSCYRAAQVTERCKKAPALVNMVMSEPRYANSIQADALQSVVRYIAQSDAGFYVFSKRLDLSTVWKWVYILGLFIFYLMTYSR